MNKIFSVGNIVLMLLAVAYYLFPTEKKDFSLDIIHVPFAHENHLNGSGVKVAVIDQGFDCSHSLIKDKISSHRFNTDTSRLDVQESMLFEDNKYQLEDHGTHVVGIIASKNPKMSIAPNAEIIPIKVGLFGGDQAFVKALNYAALTDAHIVNISLKLSHSSTMSHNVREALIHLAQAGKIIVIAAGNDGIPMDATTYTEKLMLLALDHQAKGRIVVVGALSYNKGLESLAKFSNYPGEISKYAYVPFITAPGDNILSATSRETITVKKSGTSMATPMVAGSFAILRQCFPDHSPEDLVKILLGSARQHSINGEKLESWLYGQGIVDLKTAVSYKKS